jgi:DNA-binding LytR/AlgR family response regulator
MKLIEIETEDGVVSISIAAIVAVECVDDVTFVLLTGGRAYETREPYDELTRRLSDGSEE